jgi:superfamily II DNA/RNA helicase
MDFLALGLDPRLGERLLEKRIREPLGIQKLVIPRLGAGESLIFRSPTGTGKTFAYLLPMIDRLLKDAGPDDPGHDPLALICAPTYELCSQIKGEADFLLRDSPLKKAALIIGQANLSRQIEALKKEKPQIIVGNPGRLLLLARMGKLRFKRLRFLVLDEGDRLCADELFEETGEAARLCSHPGLVRAACSATFSPKSLERIGALFSQDGGEAAFVTEDENILRTMMEHWAIFSPQRRKIQVLRSFIAAADSRGSLQKSPAKQAKKSGMKALIFTSLGGQVGNILSQLQFHHLPAGGLWGDMNKKNRKQALDDFRAGRIRFLVTSDLAARGLHIEGLSHVIALDTAADPGAYIHRAGRTARAGRRGIVVTIGDEEEMRLLAGLEKKLGIIVYPKELRQGRILAPEE